MEPLWFGAGAGQRVVAATPGDQAPCIPGGETACTSSRAHQASAPCSSRQLSSRRVLWCSGCSSRDAHRAVQLVRDACAQAGGLAGAHFGRGHRGRGPGAIAGLRRRLHRHARGGGLFGQLRQLVLHGLELADGTAELHSLAGVGQRQAPARGGRRRRSARARSRAARASTSAWLQSELRGRPRRAGSSGRSVQRTWSRGSPAERTVGCGGVGGARQEQQAVRLAASPVDDQRHAIARRPRARRARPG